jgi:hypothetical protein
MAGEARSESSKWRITERRARLSVDDGKIRQVIVNPAHQRHQVLSPPGG